MTDIFKNIKFSLITFVSQIITGSLIFIILAKIMSIDDFGLLSFGSTLAGLIAVLAEFGYSLMAQRDIPQGKFNLNEYVFNVIIQKFFLSCLCILIGGLYLLFNFKNNSLLIGLIFLVNAIITSNVSYFLSVFRATNSFLVESKSSVIYLFFVILTVVLYFYKNNSIYFIASGLLISRSIQLITLLYNYLKIFGWVKMKFQKKIQIYLLNNASSFGFFYVIGIFYFSIDSQLIAFYSGNKELALYQAFFKLITLMLIFNELLTNVFLPYLSSIYVKNCRYLQTATIINKIYIFLGLGMFVFINLFASYIVKLIYSEGYLVSVILTLPLSLMFLTRISSSTYAMTLTISNHQKFRLLIVLISLIINLSLNILVIPTFGYLGAAYVSLVTHLVLIILYSYFNYKFVNSIFLDWKILIIVLLTVSLIVFKHVMKIDTGIMESVLLMSIWAIIICINYIRKPYLYYFRIIVKRNLIRE